MTTSQFEDDFDPTIDYRLRSYMRRYDELFAIHDDMQFNASLTLAADRDAYETHGPLFGDVDNPLVNLEAIAYELRADAPPRYPEGDFVYLEYAMSGGIRTYGGKYSTYEYDVRMFAGCASSRRLNRIRRALNPIVLQKRMVDSAYVTEKFHENKLMEIGLANSSIGRDEDRRRSFAEISLSITQRA